MTAASITAIIKPTFLRFAIVAPRRRTSLGVWRIQAFVVPRGPCSIKWVEASDLIRLDVDVG